MGVTFHAPISLGELVDKITILEIKTENIADAAKLSNVRRELDALSRVLAGALNAAQMGELAPMKEELRAVNEKLWTIEDDIRDCERREQFSAEFIALARAVYHVNDERAAIKKRINTHFGSALVEEKSYQEYGP